MRVLGKNDAGELIFTTATTDVLSEKKYIPMNTCWLNVPSGLSGEFKLLDRSSYTGIRNIESDTQKSDNTVYSLTGVRMSNKSDLRPGIYIQNGKKIIKK